MKRVEHTIEINVPADEVFAFASSLNDLPRWQSGVVTAEQTSPGPIGVGTTALVVRELMGQRIEAPLTVTAYQPPQLLELHTEVSGVTANATIRVEPLSDERCRVTFAMEFSASGLTAFMEPMIASAAEADIGSSLERLATAVGSAG